MKIPSKSQIKQNIIYSDDYLAALNEAMPVEEVFGKYREDIAKGKNVVGSLVMDTLGHSEYENHLTSLVMGAAKAGKWVAVIRELGRHDEGLDVVVKKHYGHVVKLGDKTFLMPSLMYAAYCKEVLD